MAGIFKKGNSLFTLILLIIILFLVYFTRRGGLRPFSLAGVNKKGEKESGEDEQKYRILYTRSLGKKESKSKSEAGSKEIGSVKTEKPYQVLYSRSLGR